MNRWILKRVMTLFLMGSIGLMACTNDNDDNASNGTDDILINGGSWRVTYFWDKDKDETSDFSGYTFIFEEGGIFKATKSGTSISGTWQLNSSSNKLIINTSVATKPLDELNDDWIILNKSDKKIELQDDRDDNEGEEFLTFEVN